MNDWSVEKLASEELEVTIVPERGGEIHSIVHRPTAAELLWHAPWPTPSGPTVPAGADFHEWYLGGWQDLLPNGEAPCVVDGVEHAQHGESWRLPADWRRESGSTGRLRVELDALPLVSERELAVSAGTLRIAERIENVGDARARFMWGQHPAWGGDLLAAGARIDLPGARTLCYGSEVDSTGRLAIEGEGRWPTIPARDSGVCDLSEVPGPEVGSHDVALLTDLAGGWYALRNPARGIGVALRFPADVFRWLWMWQPFGGATFAPFDRGTYALALEPWTSRPCLAKAVDAGEELALEPGESVEAVIEMTAFAAAEEEVVSVEAGGEIERAEAVRP